MIKPNQLRLLAQQWHNIAGASRDMLREMTDLGLTASGSVVAAQLAVDCAVAAAAMLEERADHLERMPG